MTAQIRTRTKRFTKAIDRLASPMWRLIDWLEDKVTRRVATSVPTETRLERDLAALDGRVRFPAITVTVLTMVLTFVILGQFGAMLEGMHLPADTPATVETLAKTGDVAEVRATWTAWEGQVGSDRFLAPEVIFTWHVLIDVGFIVTYTVVLAFLLIRMRRRIAPAWAATTEGLESAYERIAAATERANARRDQQHQIPAAPDAEAGRAIIDDAAAWMQPLRRLAVALALLFGFDMLEGVLLLLAYFAADGFGPAVQVAYYGKWGFAFLLLAGLAFFAAAAPAPRRKLEGVDDPIGRAWRGLLALRVPILLVGVFAAFFFGVMDQFPDVPRRWSVVQAAATVGLALALAGAIWSFAFGVARRIDGLCRPSPKPGLRDKVVAWVLGLAGASLLAGWLSVPIGKGMLIPAAMVLAFALAGSRLPDPKPPRKCPDPKGIVPRRALAPSAPRFLGAAVVAILGLSVVISATPDLGFQRDGVAESRGWLLLLVLVPAVFIYLSTRRGREWVRSLSERFGDKPNQTVLGFGWFLALAVLPVVVPVLLLGHDGPELSTPLLFSLGVVIAYLAYAVYYYFDEDYSPIMPTGRVGKTLPTLQQLLFAWQPANDTTGTFLGWSRVAQRIFWGAGAAYLLAVLLLAWVPIPVAAWIGSTALVLLFLLLIAVLAELAALFAEHTQAPEVLRHLGVERTPVFILLAVWILLASQFSFFRIDDYHDVRILTVEGAEAARQGTSLEGSDGVFARWTANNQPAADADGERRHAVPLVIVSAWGGGIRAAVWTSLVLDCMFEPGHAGDQTYCNQGEAALSERLFAISGISGGTLGAIEYTAYLESVRLGLEVGTGEAGSWVPEAMGDDYLSPTLSQLLFVDGPLSLAGHVGFTDDRATVSERAWEASWPKASGEDETLLGTGLFELWDRNPRVPLIVANGASRADKCGLNGSVLDESVERVRDGLVFDDCKSLDPYTDLDATDEDIVSPAEAALVGNRDLVDFLCADEDVRLSSTAMLSARFNYVSPSGRLVLDEACGADDVRAEQRLYMIDGGNLELSGTLTAFQLWDAIEPLVAAHNATADYCIVPFMVHLENGFSPPQVEGLNPDLPNEWLVGTGNLRDGLVGNARARAALEFSTPLRLPDGTALGIESVTGGIPDPTTHRYAFVTTQAHPGVSAPLGWSLSERAMDDLVAQLAVNEDQLGLIQQWLQGGMTCDPLDG